VTDLNFFIPLSKADAAQRLVYGYATAERPDRAGEICDYASTKPLYEQWSADCAKASGGKSLGNVRAMHGKVAAGKIAAIDFNDDEKRIEIAAHIVDDAEWRKIEEGVYTGFSQGGAYVKRWPDADHPELTRYTAQPSEISLVDLPCLPEASFELLRADGAREMRKFVTGDVSEPTPSASASSVSSDLADWLLDPATADAKPVEILGRLFAEIGQGLGGDDAAALAEALAQIRATCLAALPEPAPTEKKAKPEEPQFEKLFAAREAEVLAKLAPQFADLEQRLKALERAPAPPPLMAGYAPVSKSATPNVDDLAAELARLSPSEASLLLIKAAQTQPRRFG